jgi:hypothetical protein
MTLLIIAAFYVALLCFVIALGRAASRTAPVLEGTTRR